MNNTNENNTLNKYSFKLNNIGDALAYIVSNIENTNYTYTAVRTYSWNEENNKVVFNGPYYNLAIVRNEYINCDFRVNNENEIWKINKLALIFNNKDNNTSITESNKDTYLRIFKNSSFSYLQDYIELLAKEKENGTIITRELALNKAILYCNIINNYDNSKVYKLKK